VNEANMTPTSTTATSTPGISATTVGPGYGVGTLGLGVDLGVIPAAESTVDSPAESRDAFTRESPPKDANRSRDDGNTRRVGDNPFDKLARQNAHQTPRRVAETSNKLDNELDLDFGVLARLVALEKKLGGKFGDSFAKLRQGSMLLTCDGNALRHRQFPLDNEAMKRLSQLIADKGAMVTREEVDAVLKLEGRFFAGMKMSVQALVQRVLRESYQLQNQLLWDYGERVRRLNKQKKTLREELLEPARQTKSVWASLQSLLGKDETYRADEPFLWRELDDNGDIVTLTLSEEDAAYYQSAAADAASDSSTGSFLQRQLQILNGPSRLTGTDKEILEMMKGTAAAGNEDFMRDRLDELCSAVGRMNKDDLKMYLKPLLHELFDGITDDEEILEVYRNLEPAQFMFMIAQGYEEEKLDLGGSESDEFIMMARLAANELADEIGRPLSDFEKKATKVARSWRGQHRGMSAEQIIAHENLEIKGDEARKLLNALGPALELENQVNLAKQEEVEQTNPIAGAPRPINTMKQMDEYIETLEQKLNSIGDDAQLANVDLQNALQKQQQTLQMMSNISKILHDTSMAMIRKVSA